jgi:hypothetical protein
VAPLLSAFRERSLTVHSSLRPVCSFAPSLVPQTVNNHRGSAQLGQERYKPTEHGGKTESGEQNKRVKGQVSETEGTNFFCRQADASYQESEAHASNTEELAHGSHHAAQMKSKEGE